MSLQADKNPKIFKDLAEIEKYYFPNNYYIKLLNSSNDPKSIGNILIRESLREIKTQPESRL